MVTPPWKVIVLQEGVCKPSTMVGAHGNPRMRLATEGYNPGGRYYVTISHPHTTQSILKSKQVKGSGRSKKGEIASGLRRGKSRKVKAFGTPFLQLPYSDHLWFLDPGDHFDPHDYASANLAVSRKAPFIPLVQGSQLTPQVLCDKHHFAPLRHPRDGVLTWGHIPQAPKPTPPPCGMMAGTP